MKKVEIDYDYKELGLKIGIEIHQQLNSKTKLFCNCPNALQGTKKPDFTIMRKQRPVLGEEGQFDKGMLVEFLKRGNIIYEGYYDATCTYELDETPPFECNSECIDIALEICELFNTEIVREMHVCRKNYVDGSVPGGFQRTMLIGQNGSLLLKNGSTIGIENIFLEEDAARRTDTKGKTSYFRIDRLGIPLTEITTTPDIHTPEDAKDAAYRIGLLLRSTNKVKRVLGSTRQDINISIKNGQRIEVKGVQKLDWIPLLVKFECQRQLNLIEIKDQLKENPNVKKNDIIKNEKDLSKIFKNTKCNFVKRGIKKGLKFIGLKIPGFKGIYGKELYTNIRFGTEVAGKVKVLTGLQGLIHSDEELIKKYQFSEEEISQTKQDLKINDNDNDLFVFLLAKGRSLEIAIDIILDRTKMAFDGVPEETRQANDDGTHVFLRELGGQRRLYPDTDTPSISIENTRIKRIKKNIGPYPWDVIAEKSKKYDLDPEMIEDLIMTGKIELFENLIGIMPNNAILVVRTITDVVKVLRRGGKEIDNLEERHFTEILNAIKDKKIAKEGLEEILEIWTKKPNLTLKQAKDKAGIKSFDMSKLHGIIGTLIKKNLDLIKERGRGAMGPLMGDLMNIIGRGTVDGKVLSSKLMKEIGKHVKK